MATKNYKYRCNPPVEGQDIVVEQLRAARRYQHVLTTIERANRSAYDRLLRDLVGDLELAQDMNEMAQAWEDAGRAYISKQHSKRRSKKTSKEESARLRQLRAIKKQWGRRASELRQRAKTDPLYKTRVKQLDEKKLELQKAARSVCGVYWGSYLKVEAAVDQAAKDAKQNASKLKKVKASGADQATVRKAYKKSLPKYRPFVAQGYVFEEERAGEGTLAVQLQGGVPCISVMTGEPDSRFRIDTLPETQWDTRPGRRAAWTRVHLRIGSEGRAPVWATWPVLLHRPLPKDGVIKWASMHRRVQGTRIEWHLVVTVDVPDQKPVSNPRTVAVHLGWRKRPEGLRIAMIADEEGRMEEVLLRPSAYTKARKEAELRGLLKDLFNRCHKELCLWLQAKPRLPTWWNDRARTVHLWKSDLKLVRLAEFWNKNRFKGDEKIFAKVWHWRDRWRHLFQWASGLNRKVNTIRQEQRRLLAVQLRKEYGTLVMCNTVYSDLALLKPAETKDEEARQEARFQRRLASPGDTRETLRLSVKGAGLAYRQAESKNLTKECYMCEGLCDFDAERYLLHTCEHCGARWDQDKNAALNLLKRERRGETVDPEASRSVQKGSRFARRRKVAEAAE